MHESKVLYWNNIIQINHSWPNITKQSKHRDLKNPLKVNLHQNFGGKRFVCEYYFHRSCYMVPILPFINFKNSAGDR